MKKKLKRLEKRLSYLSIQNNPKRRKGGNSSKKRRNAKIVKTEKEDSGNDTEIISDSENNKTQVESAHNKTPVDSAPPGSLEVPLLKRENVFYGVFPKSDY